MENAPSLPDDPVSAAEALIAENRAEEAATLLQACLGANRGGLLLRLTLQKALLAKGDVEAALAVGRDTTLLSPDAAPAVLALGDVLRAGSYLPAAIGEYQRALRLDPRLDAARIGMGLAWLDAGEAGKALDTWREVRPEDWAALPQMIAEAEAVLAQSRSDPRYVRHLFDQFAPEYDTRMVEHLHYRAPAILRELGDMLGLGFTGPHAILDLGCGTGLMGTASQGLADRLDGVDLSPLMIEKARERGIYDSLFQSDIVDWLAACDRRYDLVFAADTLVYLGELTSLFAGLSPVLSPGGHFLFTVEAKDGEGFELGPKRRWRHSEAYLRSVAEGAGLEFAAIVTCALRTEATVPVQGFAVALRA
ncbi:MAG TPA: methyltransferase domain-containing protein [Rhizomicrobium sp.]|jgi:predicted TPR repeat methyltransferase|nr:methyltransferase domain-containing protein [Rhizomicrobium sp.]